MNIHFWILVFQISPNNKKTIKNRSRLFTPVGVDIYAFKIVGRLATLGRRRRSKLSTFSFCAL